MFAYFRGNVYKKIKDRIILDVNGVGYEIFMPEGDIERLTESKEAQIIASTDIKEGYIAIFGFLSEQEKSVFDKLKKVSGIGSKTALNVLSNMEPGEICMAIANEDATLISKVPGIGKKTAERIIVELKDNILKDVDISLEKAAKTKQKTNTASNEAVLALKVLGYSTAQITEALKDIETCDMTVEQIIKVVLSKMKWATD